MNQERIILASDDFWIKADEDCLVKWQCGMKVYEMLWIRGKQEANPGEFITDVFTGATFFIWVVVTIALVVSALMLIFAAGDEKFAEKWKSWIKYSIIWLLLVIFSYSIIKLIQLLSAW